MHLTVWMNLALGYAVSILMVGLFFVARRFPKVERKGLRWIVGALAICLLGFAAYVRIQNIYEMALGQFVFEEVSASYVYIDAILGVKYTWAGATQLFYFLVMHLWRSLVGLSPILSRWLSFGFGVGAIFFLGLASRRLLSSAQALFVSALMGLSLYSIFFSTLAIEPGWTLLFFSLSLFVFSLSRPNDNKAFWIGLLSGIGIFTYPGYLLWLVSVVIAALIVYRSSLVKGYQWLKPAALGFCYFFVPATVFHFVYYADRPFLKGGGLLLPHQNSYVLSVFTHIIDLFIKSESYYLLYVNRGFVEYALWGVFVIGVWRLVIYERQKWAGTLLLSMFILLPISALATNLPGMRRAILFLGPFYFFAGVGLELFLATIWARRLIVSGTGLVLVSAMAFLIAEGAYEGIEIGATVLPFNAFTKTLVSPEFRETLKTSKVKFVYSIPSDFYQNFFDAFPRLIDRYEPIAGILAADQVQAVVDNGEGVTVDLKVGERAIVYFEKEGFIDGLRASTELCIRNLRQISGPPQPLFSLEIMRDTKRPCQF